MLVAGFPAGPWGTNCWVVAPRVGSECLVIDPGKDSGTALREVLERHRLRPMAVLLTHGHIDHMWSVTPVSADYGMPAYVHPADRYRLTDPWGPAGPPVAFAAELAGIEFVEPNDVRPLEDGEVIPVGELDVSVRHTPGHTEGSVIFRIEEMIWTGDLLFAGSVGRTDLAGGDPAAMAESLARLAADTDDDVSLHPGHGPSTTMGAERRANPYLRAALAGAL